MPNANFFRSLGLFAQENFLEPEFCAQLRKQMAEGKSEAATIFEEKKEDVLAENVRKVSSVDVERSLEDQTRDRLLAVMPDLQNHFKVSLDECQGPEFLKYGVGSFYLPHKDGNPGGHAIVAKRRVSAVVFLNAQSKEPTAGAHCGGSLTFYGLMDGAEWGKMGFPLEAETGLLIAFQSDVVHEVQQVTFGERFSIVSWFTSKE
jgi:SM-20-related protein